MATEKTAHAVWNGDLVDGSGRVSTGTGSVDAEMTWAARAQDVEGASPEELIAAAHATCVSMALAAGLARAGTPPTRLETDATTAFDKVGEGFGLTTVKLTIRGEVEGLDEDGFRRAAEEAKENCPVSKALAGNVEIELDAALAWSRPFSRRRATRSPQSNSRICSTAGRVSYVVRRNSSSPSSRRIDQAARVSPSSGIPTLPGLTRSVSSGPGRRNCR